MSAAQLTNSHDGKKRHKRVGALAIDESSHVDKSGGGLRTIERAQLYKSCAALRHGENGDKHILRRGTLVNDGFDECNVHKSGKLVNDDSDHLFKTDANANDSASQMYVSSTIC